MSYWKRILVSTALTLLANVYAIAQEQNNKDQPERGTIELGVRQIWGAEDGRPDLPFRPNIVTSKFNEYRDVRNGFFIQRFRFNTPSVLGSKYYFNVESQRAIFKDQSYLATFGSWSGFKLQFRYDEIPHIYTNTSRTPYNEFSNGVFKISPFLKTSLQNFPNSSTSLPSLIQTQVVPGLAFITPRILRQAGTVTLDVQPSKVWDMYGMFMREHEMGTRPISMVFNSSPSATLSSGFGAEVPEPIDYYTNNLKVGVEFGNRHAAVQLNYIGSFFQNNINSLTFDNPFRATDCVAPGTAGNLCTTATQGPATGRFDLYPDNTANYLNVAGSIGLGKFGRLMGSVTPGWLRQNDRFLPYTSNSILEASTGALPVASLGGDKQTLAMTYRLVTNVTKHFQFVTSYRQYDYNNNTPSHTFTPIQGDISVGVADSNTPWSYNRKTFEVTGEYLMGKKSSLKAGYVADWMDRTNRDVAHSLENGFIAALDWVPRKDLALRVSYRYSKRTPDSYADDAAALSTITPTTGITEDQIFSRRFDESARQRNRGDATIEYTPTDRITLSAFGGTLQDNFNLRGGTNSAAPLNFIAGTAPSYYLYGLLKDISYNYGADVDVAMSDAVSFFGEYSHEKYAKRMATRYRAPGTTATCGITVACDSANNDWASTARDWVDIWTGGFDTYFGKKIYFTTYYSLSAGKGHVDSFPLGNPAITTGANTFLLTGTNAAVPYPETTNRTHEVVAIVKFKISKNLTPKFEYRFQQWDNRDYQTTAMTPYMGCVSAPTGAATPGCTTPIGVTSTTVAPFFTPTPSGNYPFSVVGDPSAQRFLFMGADQPSYHVHYAAAGIEYHF